MATIELVDPFAEDAVMETPNKGVHSIKVISRGRKGTKRTAQVVVTPAGGGRPFTRHLVSTTEGFMDTYGRVYTLPSARSSS